MAASLSNLPARRGGTGNRPNRAHEFRARNVATDWASRNVALASREELCKTRDSLLTCGIVISPHYSAPARLLAVITSELASRPV